MLHPEIAISLTISVVVGLSIWPVWVAYSKRIDRELELTPLEELAFVVACIVWPIGLIYLLFLGYVLASRIVQTGGWDD